MSKKLNHTFFRKNTEKEIPTPARQCKIKEVKGEKERRLPEKRKGTLRAGCPTHFTKRKADYALRMDLQRKKTFPIGTFRFSTTATLT